jgi:hypothetical protein
LGYYFNGKSCVLILRIKKLFWATFWATFFTNSSGHPGCQQEANESSNRLGGKEKFHWTPVSSNNF